MGYLNKLHKTLSFCVDGFATDYDSIYTRARCRELSFVPVARADIEGGAENAGVENEELNV